MYCTFNTVFDMGDIVKFKNLPKEIGQHGVIVNFDYNIWFNAVSALVMFPDKTIWVKEDQLELAK